jgi:predicted nucleic acid-binding protein
MPILVDSSIWIELFRPSGDGGIKLAMTHLTLRKQAALCGPVVMELVAGTTTPALPKLKSRLSQFAYLQGSEEIWTAAGRHHFRLRTAGISVPWNDILIATLALTANCRLYSADRHFPAIATVLGLRLYTPGPGGTFVPESS